MLRTPAPYLGANYQAWKFLGINTCLLPLHQAYVRPAVDWYYATAGQLLQEAGRGLLQAIVAKNSLEADSGHLLALYIQHAAAENRTKAKRGQQQLEGPRQAVRKARCIMCNSIGNRRAAFRES